MVSDDVQATLKETSATYARLYKINQRWDIGLTITAITFAMLAGVVGAFGGNSKLLSEDAQKIVTGILATISAAVQTAQSKFPVQTRAKGYFNLKRRSNLLEIEAKQDTVADTHIFDSLKKILDDEADVH
jgi:hypothetical protein